MARGLRELLNMLAEDDGTLIRDVDDPEGALVTALVPQPEELGLVRAAVALLVEQGFLGSDGRSIWIPGLPAAQSFRDTPRSEPGIGSDAQRPPSPTQSASSTERVRRHRAQKRARLDLHAFPGGAGTSASVRDAVTAAVSPSVTEPVSPAVSFGVSASRGDREQELPQVLNRQKNKEKDLLPPHRAREAGSVTPVSSSVSALLTHGPVSARAVSPRDRSDDDEEEDSFDVHSELPRDLESALALPIHARATLVVEKPELARVVHPERWPEVRSVADALAEASGLKGGYLGSYETDDGVQAVVRLYAAGIPQAGLEYVARTVPRQPWWSSNGKRLGLSSLTLEVVRRNLPGPDGRSRVTCPGVVKAIASARRETEAANERA
jgi:hypothetical protein